MTQPSGSPKEVRNNTRLKLPAMYTLVRLKAAGSLRSASAGHIYDISYSGMRFELDNPIEPGTDVEVRALLPGKHHTSIQMKGRVVRAHGDDDDGGPARMAMTFDTRAAGPGPERLAQYLSEHGIQAA